MSGKHSKNEEIEEEIPKAFQKNKSNKNSKKKKKKMGILSKIVIVLIIILLLLVGSAFMYFKSMIDKTQKVDIGEDLGISRNTAESLKKYRNIAIFGVDSRSDDYGKGNRSDCIIIASINNDTGKIKLVSVYRDTYVKIDGHGLDKITHAYSYGEAPLAIKTLNTNLDLNIEEFATVNFDSVAEAVDQLGGVPITVTDEEAKYLNMYIVETSKVTGKKADNIPGAGTYNMNGVQAVSFSRIRYTAGADYKRTERMRTVLEAMLNKLKTKNVAEINSFANVMLPKIYTNIGLGDVISLVPSFISLVPSLSKFSIDSSVGWPYNTKGWTSDRYYGVPITLESNVLQLHKEVFDEPDYVVPDSVKTISNSIITKTGYTK